MEIVEELTGAPGLYSTTFELAEVGYECREYLVRGEAVSYVPRGGAGTVLGDDGRWDVESAGASGPSGSAGPAAYVTRIVVYRPIDPARCSGTVALEWCNVSGGLDVAVVWLFAHRELMRSGHVLVAVSAQLVGIEGGGMMPGMGLRQTHPDRYASLHHPGDAYSYDIFSQAAALVRGPGAEPLTGAPVRQVVAVGASQSAIFLTTHANAVDPVAGAVDGYLLHGRAGTAAPLDGWYVPTAMRAVAGDAPLAELPVLSGAVRIRDDVRVPVLIVQSETDVVGVLEYLPARQPDGEHLRLWEVAGASHADQYFLQAAARDSGLLPIEELAERMAVSAPASTAAAALQSTGTGDQDPPINAGPQMHYVLHAALRALVEWAGGAGAPASGDRLATSSTGALELDDDGNARGGIRTPWMEVPTAVLSGLGQTGPMMRLLGSTSPWVSEALAGRYPEGVASYLPAFTAALDDAIAAGFLLADDRAEILALAEAMFPTP